MIARGDERVRPRRAHLCIALRRRRGLDERRAHESHGPRPDQRASRPAPRLERDPRAPVSWSGELCPGSRVVSGLHASRQPRAGRIPRAEAVLRCRRRAERHVHHHRARLESARLRLALVSQSRRGGTPTRALARRPRGDGPAPRRHLRRRRHGSSRRDGALAVPRPLVLGRRERQQRLGLRLVPAGAVSQT